MFGFSEEKKLGEAIERRSSEDDHPTIRRNANTSMYVFFLNQNALRPSEHPPVCVLCFLPIHSGHQWTYQPGSRRRKVTQDF